jgi:hypothetical protein
MYLSSGQGMDPAEGAAWAASAEGRTSRRLTLPRQGINGQHIAWHRAQVFRGMAM